MTARKRSRQTLLHLLRMPLFQSGAPSVSYISFFLTRSIKCKSFYDIGKSSPCSKRHRNAQSHNIYVGTDASRHCLTQMEILTDGLLELVQHNDGIWRNIYLKISDFGNRTQAARFVEK